jgi:hypothetical protein
MAVSIDDIGTVILAVGFFPPAEEMSLSMEILH